MKIFFEQRRCSKREISTASYVGVPLGFDISTNKNMYMKDSD